MAKSKLPSKSRNQCRPRAERQRKTSAGETVDQWQSRMLERRIPLPMVFMARSVVGSAAPILEMLKELFAGTLFADERLKPVPPEQWEQLYRDESLMMRGVRKALRPELGPLRSLIVGLRWIQRRGIRRFLDELVSRWNQLSEDERRKELTVGRESGLDLLKFVGHVTSETEASERPEEFPVELQFLLRVYGPCLLLCGRTPRQLFDQAAHENVASMLELIRLDRTVQYLPSIRAVLSVWERERNSSRMQLVNQARNEPPLAWKDRRRFKLVLIKRMLTISGELRCASDGRRQQFSKNDLLHLFDAVSRSTGAGQPDVDLPDDPAAYAKAVTRMESDSFSIDGWDIFVR